MIFKKHTDLNFSDLIHRMNYFSRHYLEAQSHPSLRVFENGSYFVPFSLDNERAVSMEKSPFGSFLQLTSQPQVEFASFEAEIVHALRQEGIKELLIKHPSSIFSDFVDSEALTKVGYRLLYQDINQHIRLSDDWEDRLHKMQVRKLHSLRQEGFEFRQIPLENYKTVHQFLAVCRQAQGLQINISLETLETLCKQLPHTYQFFGVFREDKMSSVCICAQVNHDTAYYYLPGTSPLFRSQSPMVLLIAGMVNHYREQGLSYFDLGVSSIHGKPQDTLRIFKERMGAQETAKPTFTKQLI